jgi:hypothetical protein
MVNVAELLGIGYGMGESFVDSGAMVEVVAGAESCI